MQLFTHGHLTQVNKHKYQHPYEVIADKSLAFPHGKGNLNTILHGYGKLHVADAISSYA